MPLSIDPSCRHHQLTAFYAMAESLADGFLPTFLRQESQWQEESQPRFGKVHLR